MRVQSSTALHGASHHGTPTPCMPRSMRAGCRRSPLTMASTRRSHSRIPTDFPCASRMRPRRCGASRRQPARSRLSFRSSSPTGKHFSSTISLSKSRTTSAAPRSMNHCSAGKSENKLCRRRGPTRPTHRPCRSATSLAPSFATEEAEAPTACRRRSGTSASVSATGTPNACALN